MARQTKKRKQKKPEAKPIGFWDLNAVAWIILIGIAVYGG